MGCSYNLTLAMEFIPPFNLSVNCLLVEMRYSTVLLLSMNCRGMCCAARYMMVHLISPTKTHFPSHFG